MEAIRKAARHPTGMRWSMAFEILAGFGPLARHATGRQRIMRSERLPGSFHSLQSFQWCYAGAEYRSCARNSVTAAKKIPFYEHKAGGFEWLTAIPPPSTRATSGWN